MIPALKKLFGKKPAAVIPPDAHRIRPADISADATMVVEKLQKHGYTAYIVGGAVRDILLGFHPKDFDIGTDATPEQVKALFKRQARLIGRRFPIAHVYPRKHRKFEHYLEVTTFRGSDDKLGSKKYYGAPVQDARRRDFTVNGIFYDPVSGYIYDYVGGAADIQAKKLRMIGAADKRLPEDPVRILRALRLSTKLGLVTSEKLDIKLAQYAPGLAEVSHSRLFNELLKVINSGASSRIFQQWREFDLCRHIMPVLEDDNPMFFSILAENDRRVAEQRVNSLSFIVAGLFWQQTAAVWHEQQAAGLPPIRAMEQAIAAVPFRSNRLIPQTVTARAKDLYFMQAQMQSIATPRRARSILEKNLFDRALAFASLRQDSGAAQTASWWAQFRQANAEERERMLESVPKAKRRRRRGKAAPQ